MRTNFRFRVGIVADDLTSAADGAGPFVARGMRARIGRRQPIGDGGDIVAADSGSRSLAAAAAARRVAELTSQLAASEVLYKTVGSTLRGHVSAVMAAAFSNSGRKTLVFAPAFPAAGRTTAGGIQYVDGMPVSESAYGRDPVHPARTSSLADLIPDGIGDVVLADAETQDELNAKVAAFDDPRGILWVGSPGMAEALARRLAGTARVQKPFDAAAGGILVAIGTANPRSHRQADRIDGLAGVTVLRAPRERQADPAEILAGGRPLMIAMKAGGFGDDDTLRRVYGRLRREPIASKRALP
jgi:uncharacterized protein YgbK (DUF1537 family)